VSYAAHGDKSCTKNGKSCAVSRQQLRHFDWKIMVLCTNTEHRSFQCSCTVVHEVNKHNVAWVMIAVCVNFVSLI